MSKLLNIPSIFGNKCSVPQSYNNYFLRSPSEAYQSFLVLFFNVFMGWLVQLVKCWLCKRKFLKFASLYKLYYYNLEFKYCSTVIIELRLSHLLLLNLTHLVHLIDKITLPAKGVLTYLIVIVPVGIYAEVITGARD